MRRGLIVGATLLALAGCAGTMAEKEPLSAEASLKDKDGKDVGRATLIETAEGMRIAVTGYRLPPGPKGVRFSAKGACQPPQFVSAGGLRAVELPPLNVPASGEASIDVTTKAATLGSGANSLLGGEGAAIIIYGTPAAVTSDAAGAGGGRFACGVITR